MNFATIVGSLLVAVVLGAARRRPFDSGSTTAACCARATSPWLLLVSLVAVVGLAKLESPAIEDVVADVGAPQSAVGVVAALTVSPGRATLQEAGVHLVLFASFVFLAFVP